MIKSIFLIVFTVLISSNAFSTSIILHKGSERFDQKWSSSYKYNKELSRAWIEIEIATSDTPPRKDTYRSAPNLLSFDKENNEIVFNNTPCAFIEFKQRRRRVIEILKRTQDCKIYTKMITEMFDDGYDRYPVTYKAMVLEVND